MTEMFKGTLCIESALQYKFWKENVVRCYQLDMFTSRTSMFLVMFPVSEQPPNPQV